MNNTYNHVEILNDINKLPFYQCLNLAILI